MRVEALVPLRVKRPSGVLELLPGVPVELDDSDALRLLEKAPGKVRVVTSNVMIEPATQPDGAPLTPIYWETGDGRILGPAVPEFLAREGDTFWIVITFEEQVRWIHADQLRSRKQFEEQRSLGNVELVQELR